jgi:hypothetical protein
MLRMEEVRMEELRTAGSVTTQAVAVVKTRTIGA